MKELLRQLAVYNGWANQKLCEIILQLPDDLSNKELPSSFTSIRATLLHMWDAESIWWQRMKLQEVVIAPSTNFSGSIQDAVAGLQQQNRLWEEWLANATEMALDHVFSYYNLKKEHFKQPTYQVCLQVINHGTYHRGQLVNMLRQLGVQKIPQTDFIVWSRKK
ncbi:MAG TPA: DinB family protein [Chitinophagaceae bacterium]|nr:DinB family protein [Chitinophagaceae bacterium]